jgi:fatty acid desaturase
MVDSTMTSQGASVNAARGEEFRDDARCVRSLLPGAEIKRLSKVDTWRGTMAIAETWGVIVLAVAAALTWWTPWVVIPAIFVIGSRQHALFVLAHEATHYRLYGSRWLNDLIGSACATPAGLTMRTYRVIHRLHHNHLYGAEDPDIALHAGYPRGRAYLAKKLLKDLAGFTWWKTYGYFYGNPALNDDRDTALRPLDDTSPGLRAAARRDRSLVFVVQVALLVGAFAAGYGVEYLVLWVLPAFTVLQAFLRLRAVLEHGAVDDFTSPLTAARTNLAAAPLLWLLFPHHVNYHIEHHLYPAIPHYNLPEAHRLLRDAGALDGAEVARVGDSLGRVFAAPA